MQPSGVSSRQSRSRRVESGRMSESHILVVEDEPSVGEVVSLYLRRAGYQVSLLGDGRQALELIERQAPHLVVLDLMLPGVDEPGRGTCFHFTLPDDAPLTPGCGGAAG